MSQYLTMEIEQEGSAKIIPGDLDSNDLFFAPNIPYSKNVVHNAAKNLSVKSIFDFAVFEELEPEAEVIVLGKTLDELENEDDFDLTEEIEDKIDLVYYRIGPWYTPDEGRQTGRALLQYFLKNPKLLEESRRGSGVVSDLESFLEALDEVTKRGKRFRLHFSC